MVTAAMRNFGSPSKTRALLFFSLALGTFSIGIAEFAAMSLVPMMARSFHISDPQAGHAIVCYAAGVCIGAPAIALISATKNRRTMLIAMMLLYMVGNGLSALAPNFEIFELLRFFSGLPHGAYFGMAGILAASLVSAQKSSQAVGYVILGLTIATIGGVPLANAMAQRVGWRFAFGLIAGLACLTALLLMCFAPHQNPKEEASFLKELKALKMRQVWLTLAIGAVGFGGIFCVYTYLASVMLNVTHAPVSTVPMMLAVFGVGLTGGTLVCSWLADKKMMPTLAGVLLMGAASMAGFPEAAHHQIPLAINVFLIGASGGGLATVISARLLKVAVGAEGLAAALNQSAFNIANALGPWLGGLAISAGWGWTSVGWVGVALSMGGFLIYLLSAADEARSKRV